ncbi:MULTISPECIES: DUF4255 domain-containing protein [unclassified Pseudomonas]|uniref:DUF4255 domain-containing protein n=1 Tax=unclassified Pseudomonas TaxID=196821 RepID=UPI0038580A9A
MKSTKDNTHSAIIKLNTALEDVLNVGLGTDVIIRFDLPKLDSPVESPTVSVFLYQLTEDLELREGEPRQYVKADKKYAVANVYLRCSYLITYWDPSDGGESGQGPDSQQMKVISWITGALINNRELPGGGSLFSRLMPSEHLNSLGNFWQALGNRPRLCLTYDATIRVPLNDILPAVDPVGTITVKSKHGIKQLRKPAAPKKAKQ